ncbi:MAG: hypothetical protein KGL39_16470 [Patescibacteria group bacterium]|nr:hypothetical protein [Patescibacteria group bacterium]
MGDERSAIEFGVVKRRADRPGVKLLASSEIRAIARTHMMGLAFDKGAIIYNALRDNDGLIFLIPYGKTMILELVHTHDGVIWEDHRHTYEFRENKS